MGDEIRAFYQMFVFSVAENRSFRITGFGMVFFHLRDTIANNEGKKKNKMK
jgi:hypothetical protein